MALLLSPLKSGAFPMRVIVLLFNATVSKVLIMKTSSGMLHNVLWEKSRFRNLRVKTKCIYVC